MPRSDAEREVLAALEKALPRTEYSIFTNVTWSALPEERTQAVGEMDLVVCHREKGVLVLEVKGGGIELDGDRYWSIDVRGGRHEIRDPLGQAEASKRHLLAVVRQDGVLASGGGFPVPIGTAVALPHVVWRASEMPSWNREQVLDRDDLWSPRAAIDRAFAYAATRMRPRGSLGEGPWTQLAHKLRPSGRVAMALDAVLGAEEKALVALTERQRVVLDALRDHTRLKTQGSAGSGKTVLAIHEARRRAHEGRRVLWLAFNRALADALRERLAGEPLVTVTTFHQLCVDVCVAAGLPTPAPQGGEDAHVFFTERLPALAFEHLDTYRERFEALVVDEAQDIQKDWWPIVELLLSPGGTMAVFYDPDQDIFGGHSIPIDGPPVYLDENCRCTAAIYRAARAVGGLPPGHPGRVIGEPPELVVFDRPQEVARSLCDRVRRLTRDERISNERIVVLSPRRLEKSWLYRQPLGEFTLVEGTPRGPYELRYATAQSFKGLEADVVLLVDVRLEHRTCSPHLLYVAFSRAKHRLCVWVSRAQEAELRARLEGGGARA